MTDQERIADLEAERDDFHDTLMRISAHLGHDMSDGSDHSSLLDDVIRLDKERDTLAARLAAAEDALKWYADVQNYDSYFTAVLMDNGRLARETLAGHAPATKGEGDE